MTARELRQRLAAGRLPALVATEQQRYAALLTAAVLLGVGVRISLVAGASFPLNDGGMFYQMTRDLQHARYLIPAETAYNGEHIPFAYPPLGFYLAGLLDDLTPLDLATVFQLVPLVCTCLAVVAVLALARDFIGGRLGVVAAVVAFALVPRSFIWLIMGGGVTRSLGFLFAMVALHQAYLLWKGGGRRPLVLAALASGATVLSHLETGYFLAFSLAIFALAMVRTRRGAVDTVVLAGGAALLVLPWFLAVAGRHGLGPFEAAQSTGTSIFTNAETREEILLTLAHGGSTAEPFFPVIGALALLGALISVVSGRLLLPAWWVAIVVLDYRAYATFASVPVSLLAGIAVSEAVIPALSSQFERLRDGRVAAIARREWIAPALGLGCLLYFAMIGVLYEEPGSEQASLRPLSPADREAMAWVQENTPESARFFVVPQSAWETDRALEWFPALAGRTSVATVQGSEWLPGQFWLRIWEHARAQPCAWDEAECLDRWSRSTGERFSYVYLPDNGGPCCETLAYSLLDDYRYEQVYFDGRVRIFEGPG